MTVCTTFDCGREATRHHSWRAFVRVERIGPRGGRRFEYAQEGELIEADYCEDCSWKLRSNGEQISPPWPLARIIPIR